MKLVNFDSPVRSSWFAEQGQRLDASPYLSGAYEARKLLERLPEVQPLGDLVRKPHGIFHAGRVSRRWVTDPEHGVPFFSSSDILEADYSYLPLIAKGQLKENPKLPIDSGWILITRSGSVGRMAFARPNTAGYACSEHVLRVVADQKLVSPGYLYAFLYSRYGIPMITSQAAGSIIQHIEPDHIINLPIPRFATTIESTIDDLIRGAAELRSNFQNQLQQATSDLFTSAGVPELAGYSWHKHPRDLGFQVKNVDTTTLRAFNFSPRAHQIMDTLRSVPHKKLGEICQGGKLSRGNRFKRIDGDSVHGVRLIGQRQGFWLRPEGRWVILNKDDLNMARASDETVLIASQGTLGENEVFCRALLVTGSWQQDFAFSEHFLRVESGDPDFPGAYLFALLRSEAMFRVLRSMSTGGKQQDIHEELRKGIPVPACTPEDRKRIAETVRQAYRDRDEADRREDEALRLLEKAVREAAR